MKAEHFTRLYLTMAELTTTNFLNNEIGKLGTQPKFELPEEFKKIWSPTGLSLEEINRRKAAVRTIQQETNTGSQTVATSNNGAAATDHVFASTSCPSNRRRFIYAAELTFYNKNPNDAAWCNCGLYPSNTASANRIGLITQVLPKLIADVMTPYFTSTVSFPIPIQWNEGEYIGIQRIYFIGEAQLRVFFWEEDVGIV